MTRLETRVKGLEKATGGTDQARGALDQRLDSLAQEEKLLRKDLDELRDALVRIEEDTSGLRIEVSRLKDRFDQIERGYLAREKQITEQVDSVAGIGDQFQGNLEDIRRQVEEAVRKVGEADTRTKTAVNDLYDRMKRLDREVQSLYDDMMGALAGGRSRPADGFHVVQAGETLGQIARSYGVSVDGLLDANPQLNNKDLIFKGQRLKIP